MQDPAPKSFPATFRTFDAMKSRLRDIFHNDLIVLLARLAVAYLSLMLLRVLFCVFNQSPLGALSWHEIPNLIRGSLLFDTANICYVFGVFVLLSLLPLRSRGRTGYQKALFWLYGFLTLVIMFFNTADTIYFRTVRKRATADELFYAGNDNTAQIMFKAAAENWYIVLPGLAILAGAVWLYRRIPYRATRIRSNTVYYTVCSVVFLFSCFLLVTGIRGGLGRAIRPITLSNAAHFAKTPQKASIVLCNPFCIIRTMGNKAPRYRKYFTEEELAAIYSPIHNDPPAADSSLFPSQKGKNIVIFILESFSYEHSAYLNPELYPDGRSYMPFLDSLMRQGYVFRRAYSNGHKSIEALPSVLASIPSFKTPFPIMPQALSPMDGLGKLLTGEGYSTWFFNGSIERSMGFVAYARLAGIDNVRTRENYEAARGTGDFDNFWGIWDEPFLDYLAEELSSAPQPFMAATFTLSSHHPFVVPAKYENALPEGKTKVQKPVAYTDLAMRNFFDHASKQDWYDNTIFVMVADHVSSETFSPAAETSAGNTHILYFMYTPDGTLRGENDNVTQQIDIMPTLLGLMEYRKPYFAFGRDALIPVRDNRDEPFAVNYTGTMFQWVTDSLTYLFDENRITGAFDLERDPLQQHDLASDISLEQQRQQRRLEAFIQSYYQAIEKGDFSYGEQE